MTLPSVQPLYRNLFQTLGYPLKPTDAGNSKAVTQAANSLNLNLPIALRDYYTLAGQERRFNHAHNDLLPPEEWQRDGNQLIFMAENQGVVLWSVDLSDPNNPDPPVSQSANTKTFHWYPEHSHCSTFLAVMLHYQAVSGGYVYVKGFPLPENLTDLLHPTWQCQGTVNTLTAYSRPNQVLCTETTLGLLIAAKTHPDLQALQTELNLTP